MHFAPLQTFLKRRAAALGQTSCELLQQRPGLVAKFGLPFAVVASLAEFLPEETLVDTIDHQPLGNEFLLIGRLVPCQLGALALGAFVTRNSL